MRLRHFVTAWAVSLTLLAGAVAQEKDADQKIAATNRRPPRKRRR